MAKNAENDSPLMRQLMDWAYNNLHDILSDRESYTQKESER